MFTKNWKCAFLLMAVAGLMVATASADSITVDNSATGAGSWQMVMNYNGPSSTEPAVSKVNYTFTNYLGSDPSQSNVALSALTNTLTGGIDAIAYTGDSAAIGWNSTGGPRSGEVSWKFDALSGGTGTFTAFTFDPASLYDWTYARTSWSVSVDGGPKMEVFGYDASNLGYNNPGLGTIDLMDSSKSYYIGANAHSVELIGDFAVTTSLAWYHALLCRVGPGIPSAAGLTVTASAVPEPSALALLAAALVGLLAYAWRKRK